VETCDYFDFHNKKKGCDYFGSPFGYREDIWAQVRLLNPLFKSLGSVSWSELIRWGEYADTSIFHRFASPWGLDSFSSRMIYVSSGEKRDSRLNMVP
jgi:hypothetical protein